MGPESEIDALLNEAESLAAHVAAAVGAGPTRPNQARPDATIQHRVPEQEPPAEVRRVLQIRIPIIVRLAERKMRVAQIMEMAPGTIIDFERGADEPLDLMTNNRCIGTGTAVKVGENFGLRVGSIAGARAKLRAMQGR